MVAERTRSLVFRAPVIGCGTSRPPPSGESCGLGWELSRGFRASHTAPSTGAAHEAALLRLNRESIPSLQVVKVNRPQEILRHRTERRREAMSCFFIKCSG